MKRILLILIGVLWSCAANAAWTVDSLTYNYRKEITIDHTYVDSDLTDFPVLIKITSDSDIGGIANADGYDVRFTSSDGSTLLKYERESFSVSGGAATAVFWVKVPTVAGASNTTIYIYYRTTDTADGQDASNVWESSYVGVYHFSEGSGTTAYDSTANSKDFTLSGSPAWDTSGIAGSLIFDGSNDMTDTMSSSNNSWTFSFYLKRDTISGSYDTLIGWLSSYSSLILYDSGNVAHLNSGGSSLATISTSFTDKTNFHHLVYKQNYIDASNKTRTYIFDGTQDYNATANYDTMTGYRLGEFVTAFGNKFTGKISEFRVSNTAKSADWLKFEYRNIAESDNEISFGSQEYSASASYSPRAIVIA